MARTGPSADWSDAERVRVAFDLPTAGSWPPVAQEHAWSVHRRRDVYVLDNIPFFATGVALGDHLQVVEGGALGRRVAGRRSWGGNCTVRVRLPADGELALGDVFERFARLDVSGEGLEEHRLAALNVPPDADLDAVIALLRSGHDTGRWDYEESCISREWRDRT